VSEQCEYRLGFARMTPDFILRVDQFYALNDFIVSASSAVISYSPCNYAAIQCIIVFQRC